MSDVANQQWLPRRRMIRYQAAKIVGGLLIAGIFAGWLVLQWSSLPMRLLAISLMGITTWVVVASVFDDLHRAKGRQIELDGEALVITQPDHTTRVDLCSVARGAWNEQTLDDAGLWLFDRAGKVLAHIDLNFLGDQDEARAFLHWARRFTPLSFEIKWPRLADAMQAPPPTEILP